MILSVLQLSVAFLIKKLLITCNNKMNVKRIVYGH